MSDKKLEFKLIVFGSGQRQHLNTDSWEKILRFMELERREFPEHNFSLLITDTENGAQTEHFFELNHWCPDLPTTLITGVTLND